MDQIRLNKPTTLRRALVAALVCVASSLTGCATNSPNYNGQRAFSKPELAVKSFAEAVRTDNVAELEAIFGPDSREALSSGDAVADKMNREVFATVIDQGWTLERLNGSAKELVVGDERWPFPIPLAKDSRGWWFDTAAGLDEVLARRIGRNELATIGALRAYTIAQFEYASNAHDGAPAGAYAQRIRSDPGTQNGLYWPTADASQPPSPLGEFAAAAAQDGYGAQPSSVQSPYRGYFFRVLTKQGPSARGGERNYIEGSRMTGGFAMIAYPAEYGNSGIMSFMVGPDGIILERDLGERTKELAGGIDRFDPTADWRPVDGS